MGSLSCIALGPPWMIVAALAGGFSACNCDHCSLHFTPRLIPHAAPVVPCSGMLILVYARNHLKDDIGEVTTASVACGVLGVGGNKGAVAVEFTVHRRKIAVVCSHFTAHQVR